MIICDDKKNLNVIILEYFKNTCLTYEQIDRYINTTTTEFLAAGAFGAAEQGGRRGAQP